MPTTTEIENGIKVLEMLSEINDVSFDQKREDIFVVYEPESGLSIVIDVEETTIIFIIDIGQSEGVSQELGELLLSINNDAVHGAFGYDSEKKKILFKDVLEIKNLDLNELEASIQSMIITVANSIEQISPLIGG